ncbi:hypothetical protein [Streptomyces liangshanensis]|uniref:hypothetical protein n=1 Tax=Streptomyces liangshanensis TaxID=2717324 RepID=UPI0036D8077C
MTSAYRTFVDNAYGSFHGGDGTQVNNHYYYREATSARLREEFRSRPRTIAEGDRAWLYRRFIEPTRFQQARRVLRDHHMALLSATPGSGLRAAALMLLHELPSTEGGFHELPDTVDDEDSSSQLDRAVLGKGDRLVLDLSGAEESRYLDVQGQLSDFRHRLAQARSHLVVLVPQRLGYILRSELRPLTTDLVRPSPRLVLARHLRCEGIQPTAAEMESADLVTHLATAPLRDVSDLAARIVRARDDGGSERGFPHWLREALVEVTDRSEQVAKQLSDCPAGSRRALLLALAVFHETTPTVVHGAATALMKILKQPSDDRPRLDHSDLHAEFKAIGATTRASGGVRFDDVGYDRAVRDHFWTYFPDIRRQLRDWVGDHVAGPELTQKERGQVVSRISGQCLRTGRPEDLVQLTERWAGPTGHGRLSPDAAQILGHGLADDRYGRTFRQQVYDWSTTGDLDPKLQQVLVQVCSEHMARTYPDQAMVRLHHLARRMRSPRPTALALFRLVEADDRLYRRLLERLSAGVAKGRWRADVTLFLALSDPTRLIPSPNVRAALTTGWGGAIRQHPVDLWRSDMHRWLMVCRDTRFRGPVLDVLTSACARESAALGSVYGVARRWARSHGDDSLIRSETAACLLRKINAAQGFVPFHSTA